MDIEGELMKKEKIDIVGISETMLIPLYARSLEAGRKNPDFIDETAMKIVNSIDYDFSKFNMSKSRMSMWGCAVRTKILDKMTKEYIAKNPNSTIINLACGLDNRFSRVDNGKIYWYNLDFESVIQLREKYIEKHERVVDIAASALDTDWYSQIEHRDNILIIAEGFVMYLSADEIKSMYDNLSNEFGKITLFVELMAKFFVKRQVVHDAVKKDVAEFKWGVDVPEDFSNLCSQFKLIKSESYTKGMKKYAPVLMTLLTPMMKKTNNQIGWFEN